MMFGKPKGDRSNRKNVQIIHEAKTTVPAFSQFAIGAVNHLSVDDLNTKYMRVFNHWINWTSDRRESRLGRKICHDLYSATGEPVKVAILVDNLEEVQRLLSDVDPKVNEGKQILHNALRFSFVSGAQQSGNWLLETLDETLNEDAIVLIASSGNMSWLRDILTSKHAEEIPGYAFEHARFEDLETLAKDMGIKLIPGVATPPSA